MIKMVENWNKKDLRCYFCGEGRSVKYLVPVLDPTIKTHPREVYCCNKCVLKIHIKYNSMMNENPLHRSIRKDESEASP